MKTSSIEKIIDNGFYLKQNVFLEIEALSYLMVCSKLNKKNLLMFLKILQIEIVDRVRCLVEINFGPVNKNNPSGPFL